ncbi:hypothetical protein CR513_24533, partial [Mucuna pruriens]
MAQGSGIMLLFCILVLYSEMAHASTYVVGGREGWSFSISTWNTTNYRAVFYYNSSLHNVVTVDEGGYNSCSTSPESKTYESGNDSIKLAPGTTYFICTFPGHCQAGMKYAAIAT